MSDYLYDDDSEILVEITSIGLESDEEGGRLVDTSIGDRLKAAATGVATSSVDTSFRMVYRMAKRTGQLLTRLQQEGHDDLKTAEIEFGVKFGVGGEPILATGEANLRVKLTWERKP